MTCAFAGCTRERPSFSGDVMNEQTEQPAHEPAAAASGTDVGSAAAPVSPPDPRRSFLDELLQRVQDPPHGSGWGKLELLGHRVLHGFLDEVEMAGARFLRIQQPDPELNLQDLGRYSAASVYGFTPMSKAEVLARIEWVQQRLWSLAPKRPALPAHERCGDCGAYHYRGPCPRTLEGEGDDDDE